MEFLSQQGVDFTEKDVTTDSAALRELARLGSRSTPTIVVGDKVHVGFRPDELLELLRSAS